MEKTTQELLEMMKNSQSYSQYFAENRENIALERMKIDRAINSLMAERNLKKADVIAKSGNELHYGYQIFSGTKTPSRDKVIMLCFGCGLDAEEAQNLLKVTGYAQLYGKEIRDNVILFGLTNHLSVIDINNALYELGLDLLL